MYKNLETWCKENKKKWLLEQWDVENNAPLLPKDIPFGSTKKYNWIYVHKDKKTGSEFIFKWQESPNRRTTNAKRSNCRCPFLLGGNRLYKGYNDLQTINPTLAKMWHPTKNGDLKPCDVMSGSEKKVWWISKYDDAKTKKRFVFEWQDSVKTMNRDMSNPYLANHKVCKGFNDLKTWCKQSNRKEILLDWDYEKNACKPSDVVYGSTKRIYWKCNECGNEWNTKLVDRTANNTGCPKCAKWSRTSFPEQAIYYYLKQSVFVINGYKPKWLDTGEIDIFIPSLNTGIEYDGAKYHQNTSKDSNKAKKCYQNGIKLIRIRENKCPDFNSRFCHILKTSGHKLKDTEEVIIRLFDYLNISKPKINLEKDKATIIAIYKKHSRNALSDKYPYLVKEWHPILNGDLKPNMFSSASSESMWWKCSVCGHEWKAIISNRTKKNSKCPKCSNKDRAIRQAKTIMCRETGEVFLGSTEAATKYGVSNSTITESCRTNSLVLKKYHFVYINDKKELHKRIAAQKSSTLFKK
ncbi:MAG: zinc-ribbon domain-containing protein [Erysipelotrichaceae bacterium]|nr:zinc-ribbon domain-containing protein [Erysipelotrichaceae bacterium]